MAIVCALIFLLLCNCPVWAGPADDERLRSAALDLDVAGVQAALDQGADPNAASLDPRPSTPLGALMLGVLSGKYGDKKDRAASSAVQIARMLFAKGAKVGIYDSEILFLPISTGNVELVSLLLDQGVSPVTRIEGYLPTEVALKYDQTDVYNLLLSRGGIPSDSRTAAQLALVEAASRSDIPGLERALKSGANIDGTDATGRTALINAVRMGVYSAEHLATIQWLLRAGADPNMKGDSGFKDLDGIPLHIFVAMNPSTLNDVKLKRRIGTWAEDAMLSLLRKGAKVSGRDSKGRTPLHLAAKDDNLRAAEILIRSGALIKPKDDFGKTPLDYAESASMIRLLKEKGATER